MATSPNELAPTLGDAGRVRQRINERVVAPLSGLAFWAAVALPFLHVPLLLATGLSEPSTTAAYVSLLACNVVALLLGHPYSRD